jgi:hypothetical protein
VDLMGSKILLVFEGNRPEQSILKSLQNHYFSVDHNIIPVFYGGNIYDLSNTLGADRDLDTFPLIKECCEPLEDIGRKEIVNSSRDEFEAIYLFFDLDYHHTQADLRMVTKLLDLFNNETEFGKIFISYPMVEAIKHISPSTCDYVDLRISAKERAYKNIVHEYNSPYQDFSRVTRKCWDFINSENFKKANWIISGEKNLPCYADMISIDQSLIFAAQEKKFIHKSNEVAVLSAFPFFILDYFGETVYCL